MKSLALHIKVASIALPLLVFTPLSNGASLLESAREGNHVSALAQIKAGTDVNIAESNGTTPLIWAVHNGDLALVEQLLKAGANVNATNHYGASAISEAAILGNPEIMALLLSSGADPNTQNEDGQTALMIVARSSNVATARLLLEAGADIDATEQWQGQNAVIWAAAQAQPDMLALLLNAGGNPNSRSWVNERTRQITSERRFQWRPAGGITALAYAAREGCVECVRLLVAAGADIDEGNAENVSPLLTAIINMHFDTAKYLVEAGANVNKWSLRGENPIYSAVDVNTLPHGGYPDRPSTDSTTSIEMIKILLEAGANPNLQLKLQPTYRHLKDDRGADSILNIGATPLLRAAKAFDVPAMTLLLEYGALPNLPNRTGITPTMAAAGLGSTNIDTRGDYTSPFVAQNSKQALEFLLSHGGEINGSDNIGRTALHGAAGWGWNEAVSYLASQGADLQAKDANGNTPLDVALGKASSSGRGGTGEVRPQTAKLIQDLLLHKAP